MGSGSIDMTFVTSPHTVSLTSSTPSCHSDKFEDPTAITKMTWAPSQDVAAGGASRRACAGSRDAFLHPQPRVEDRQSCLSVDHRISDRQDCLSSTRLP